MLIHIVIIVVVVVDSNNGLNRGICAQRLTAAIFAETTSIMGTASTGCTWFRFISLRGTLSTTNERNVLKRWRKQILPKRAKIPLVCLLMKRDRSSLTVRRRPAPLATALFIM
jgi:hypothetical protein